MSEPLELRVYRVILFLVLICCLLSTRRRRVEETKALQEEISGLRHTVRHTRANLQEPRSSTQQDRRVTEELMRFLRGSSSSQSPERLNEAESATLTPTTAEMNEFLRQVMRLKEEIQQCAERVSTTLHAQIRRRDIHPYLSVLSAMDSVLRERLAAQAISHYQRKGMRLCLHTRLSRCSEASKKQHPFLAHLDVQHCHEMRLCSPSVICLL
jgi:hypothetical protein